MDSLNNTIWLVFLEVRVDKLIDYQYNPSQLVFLEVQVNG